MGGRETDWRKRTKWELDREDLLDQVVEWGWKKELPRLVLPEDDEALSDYEDWIRCLARTARAAARHGRQRELNAMFWWMFGARDESGAEETIGLDHDDKVAISAKVTGLREEVNGHLVHDRQLHAWLNVSTAVALYESTIRDGLIFLNSLLQAIIRDSYDKGHTGLWNTAFRSSKAQKREAKNKRRTGLFVPYFDNAVSMVEDSLADVPTKAPLTQEDIDSLQELIDLLGAEGAFPDGKDLTGIRDRIAHGKFFVNHNGRVNFDPHCHNLVNVAAGTTRRGEPHPYEYRGMDYEATDGMLRTANALSVVLYAMYEEFRLIVAFCPSRQKCSIHPHLVREAKKELPRVTPDEKLEAKKRAAEERARAETKIEITDIKPDEGRD